MGVMNYFGVEGVLYAQRDFGAGGIRSYATDALGSVVATLDAVSADIENQYRYKPYGGALASSELGISPRFKWIGSFGYEATNLDISDHYVRSRHYSAGTSSFTSTAAWSSILDGEAAYGYAFQSPVTYIDYFGKRPQKSQKKGRHNLKDPCSCPDTSFASHDGYVWIDCSCKGQPISVLPEHGPEILSPTCGQWLPADGVWLHDPGIWGDPTFLKIHGTTCLVIDCFPFGKAYPLGWCCHHASTFRDCEPTIIKEPCKEFLSPGIWLPQGPSYVEGR